ncbi:hypothetical protein SPFM15_00177 [Salmonella phage SPFM15]|nr:hypothetical protein SPFM5_00172 [Salmonella phage SPFM5]VFR13801.1 hypothetical protein SPFM15_00177 [Salmonella phage SPFM15]
MRDIYYGFTWREVQVGRYMSAKQQAADGNKVVLSNADTLLTAQYHSKEFSQADHRELAKLLSNAVIYADPPYIPLSDTAKHSETNVELLCADFRDILNKCPQHPNGVYFPEEEILAWAKRCHGYNGLCRYNQSGGFNVPYGETTTGKPNLQRAAMFLYLTRLFANGLDRGLYMKRREEFNSIELLTMARDRPEALILEAKASVFLNTKYPNYILGDTNPDLELLQVLPDAEYFVEPFVGAGC